MADKSPKIPTPHLIPDPAEQYNQEELGLEEPPKKKVRQYLLNFLIVCLALAFIVGLRYVLLEVFFPSKGSGKSIAKLSYLYNKVVIKPSQDPEFKKAKLDLQLYENDTLRTYENSHAEVGFAQGGSIRMDENTLIVLKGFQESVFGRPGKLSMLLENGGLVMNLKGDGSVLSLVETKGKTLAFSPGESGSAEIGIQLQQDGNTRVISYAGSGTVQVDGQDMTLSQNESLTVGANKPLQKEILGPTNLLVSTDTLPIIFAQKIGQEVTLDWQPVANTRSYNIELARDEQFQKMLTKGVTPNDFYTYRIIGDGDYFWRVRGFDPQSDWIAKGQFSVILDDPKAFEQIAIDPQRNVVDDTSRKTTIIFQSDYPLVTFTWKPDKRAHGYNLEIFTDPEFQEQVLAQSVDSNSFSTAPGLFHSAKYYWQVASLGRGGDALDVSDVFELNLVYDNAMPFLSVYQPLQNATIATSKCPVSGALPTGSHVFVNGTEITVDERGKFSGEIELQNGTNQVIFKVIGAEGRVEYHARTVTVVKP